MIKKFEMTGSAEVKRRPGPTRKTTALIDRIILRKAEKDRRISAVKIQAQIKTEHSVDISESTVKRRIKVCLEGWPVKSRSSITQAERSV
ncbi:hypothetical protein RvY_16202 [Ramazzottius varieornatus]|uniref:Transposase Tc1-like domain-containing protein n=1 Tax=Ramazzottius varieornatus TaxID=947166 RepID=A0A1D1VXL9_RAMVA|nr:hypothetical protein RvY_16202 [Ramazzottius varieornatus]